MFSNFVIQWNEGTCTVKFLNFWAEFSKTQHTLYFEICIKIKKKSSSDPSQKIVSELKTCATLFQKTNLLNCHILVQSVIAFLCNTCPEIPYIFSANENRCIYLTETFNLFLIFLFSGLYVRFSCVSHFKPKTRVQYGLNRSPGAKDINPKGRAIFV